MQSPRDWELVIGELGLGFLPIQFTPILSHKNFPSWMRWVINKTGLPLVFAWVTSVSRAVVFPVPLADLTPTNPDWGNGKEPK